MTQAPPLSCDCHFHIFGPFDRFQLDAGRAYTPAEPRPAALLDQFLAWVPDEAARRRILVDNPVRLYAF